MYKKDIRLSPKKNGKGYLTSYSVNLGTAEIKDIGFLDENNNIVPLEKIIDEENKQIVIRIKK